MTPLRSNVNLPVSVLPLAAFVCTLYLPVFWLADDPRESNVGVSDWRMTPAVRMWVSDWPMTPAVRTCVSLIGRWLSQIEREWRESLQAGMVEDREKMAALQRANEQLTRKLEVSDGSPRRSHWSQRKVMDKVIGWFKFLVVKSISKISVAVGSFFGISMISDMSHHFLNLVLLFVIDFFTFLVAHFATLKHLFLFYLHYFFLSLLILEHRLLHFWVLERTVGCCAVWWLRRRLADVAIHLPWHHAHWCLINVLMMMMLMMLMMPSALCGPLRTKRPLMSRWSDSGYAVRSTRGHWRSSVTTCPSPNSGEMGRHLSESKLRWDGTPSVRVQTQVRWDAICQSPNSGEMGRHLSESKLRWDGTPSVRVQTQVRWDAICQSPNSGEMGRHLSESKLRWDGTPSVRVQTQVRWDAICQSPNSGEMGRHLSESKLRWDGTPPVRVQTLWDGTPSVRAQTQVSWWDAIC